VKPRSTLPPIHRALVLSAPLLALACQADDPGSPTAPSMALDAPTRGVLQLTDAARPSPLVPERITVDREIRPGFLVTPPFLQRTELTVPSRRSRLHLAHALLELPQPRARCEHGVSFRAVLRDEEGEPTVLLEDLQGHSTGWWDDWVELGAWAGERVSLELQLEERPDCSGTQGAWADIQLTTPPPPSERPPDIWIIVVDTLRADHVGHAGGAPVSTPHIDALASRAVRFTDALAAGPWTRVSVLSMMAGEYISAGEPACRFDDPCTQGGLPTMQELLRAHDYRTIGITCNPMLSADEAFHKGFDVLLNTEDHIVTTELERLLGDQGQDSPTLVYIHLMSPHEPYCFHHGISERHLEQEGVDWSEGCFDFQPGRTEPGFAPSAQDLQLARALYRGEVEWMDQALGGILALYEQRAAPQARWLFFTADHGEEFLEHGSVLHGHTLYQEQLHVPLLVLPPRPDRRPWTPRELDAPVSLVDIAHTVSELAGLPPLPTRGGRSLLDLLEGQETLEDRVRLASGVHEGPGLGARIARGSKWIWTLEDRDGVVPAPQLFELDADPGEQRDQAGQTTGAAPGASPWAVYDRLVSTGTALLDIHTPEGADPLRLVLHFDGELALLPQPTGRPAARLLPRERERGSSYVIELSPGSTATVQLMGLSERTAPPTARLLRGDAPVSSKQIAWPSGASLEGDQATLPTPWHDHEPVQDEQERPIRLRWRSSGHIGPAGLGKTQEFAEQLRALGYLE
jgi:arylsulfatase A-like enzyme